MEFRTKYNCPPLQEEPGGGKRITETAGYVPADIQIMEMLVAGRRLAEIRKDRFDFATEEEVPDDYLDESRRPGLDLAEGSILDQRLRERLLRLKAAQEEARKAQDEKKAKEEAAKASTA